jgi:hypothetical protein
MADISDNGSFNAALVNNSSQNFGPTAVANQNNTNASTALLQQQAQGAAIQNAQQALVLQGRRIGLSMLYNLPGANADQSGTSSSGATPSRGAASASSGGTPASSGATQSGDQSAPDQSEEDEELGTSMVSPEALDARLRNSFQVNHLGTPQEQMSILKAGQVSAMTGDPMYVQLATQRRDMAVAQRVYASQQSAAQHYDDMAAVVDAGDKGIAWQTLQAVAPNSAKLMAREHPQEPGESDADYAERMNEVAADSAAHFAAHVHKYSGYETDTRKDGVVIDKATGFTVAGVRGSGLSPEEYGKAIDAANAPVSVKNSDGSETQMPLWQYAKSQGMPVKSANDYVQQKAQQQQDIAQHKQQVANHLAAIQTQQQVARGQVPNTVQSGAGQPAGVTPPPGATGQQPQQLPPGDPKVLRQALTDPEFKMQTPPVISGRSQTPGDAEQQKANVTVRQTMLKDASDLTSTSSQAKAYTDAALAVLNSPEKPPTGLAAPAQVMLSRAMQAIGMTSGDWATRSQELAKYMGNLAVQNFKANFGARPAAKEFDIQMNELNPNNKMTPDAIRDLLQSNSRMAQYGIDSGRRAGLYTRQGLDPNRFNEWNEHYFPRSDAVNVQTPPTRPGQQASGAAQAPVRVNSRADAMKLAPGTIFVTPDGRQLVR